MAIGAGVIAGGALLLYALSRKSTGAGAPTCPTGMVRDGTGRCVSPSGAAPTAQPQQPSAGNPAATVIGTGTTLLTGIVAPIVKGLATGTTAATGTASTAASTVAAASSGFFSAGPLYIAAAIIIAVVATMVTMGISANIMNRQYAEMQMLLDPSPIAMASNLFNKFTEKATKWYYARGQPVPDGYSTAGAFRVVDFSIEQLRDIGLACLYLASVLHQAKNDALVRYYGFMGWTPQQMATARAGQSSGGAGAFPGLNVAASIPTDALRTVLAPTSVMFSAVRPPTMTGNPLFDAVTAPFAWTDLEPAAVRVFGADLPKVVALLRFYGTIKMVFLAALEGYGAQGGSWQTFVETIGQFTGWPAVKSVYWVTNTTAPYPLDTWWLVDPASGNRIAILETHSDNILRISIKGTPIMPNVPGSPLAGFGRFGRFGAPPTPKATQDCISEGIAPDGTLVSCAEAARMQAAAILSKQTSVSANAASSAITTDMYARPSAGLRSGGGGGLLLPVAIGVGALIFLKGRS